MKTVQPLLFDGKACACCKRFLPLSSFSVKDRRTGRLQSLCRTCLAAYSLARYHANPEPVLAHTRDWQRRNKDRCRTNLKAWRKANPDKCKAIQQRASAKRKPQKAAYRKANAARIKARNAAYRAAHQAEIKASGKAYYLANKEAVDARVKRCIAAKPELYKQLHKAAKHRRKVRLTNNGPHEKFTDREIFERDNWTCHLCGEPVNRTVKHPDPMSVLLDHVTPIANGGGHTRANASTAHLRCNLAKRNLYERRADTAA